MSIAARMRALACAALVTAACGSSEPLVEIQRLQAAGRFAESVEPLRELLAERPDDPEVNYLYGLALTRTAEPTLAIWALRKAMEDPEWQVPAAIQLGVGALYAGSQDGAIDYVNRALEADPDNVEALVLRARAYVGSRRHYDEALADADRILELDPGNADARVTRALSFLALERVEEAQVALEALRGESLEDEMEMDASGQLCAALAMFAFEKGEIDGAREKYEQCLATHPEKPLVVSAAVEFFDDQKEFERSREILEAALEADPENVDFRAAYAGRLRLEGRNDEAEQVLLAGTEVGSDATRGLAWVDLADHRLRVDKNEEAVEAFEQALKLIERPSPSLLFMYADTLLISGDYDRALQVAEQRLTTPAHQGLVRARVHSARGELVEALDEFTAAVALWPDSAEARYYTALAAEAVGDFDRSILELRASIRANQEATDSRARLARLHHAEGRDDLALAVSRQDPRKPFDRDLSYLNLAAAAREGDRVALANAVALQRPHADSWPGAVAAVAEGTRDATGPEQGALVVRQAELDLTLPQNADALRMLVVMLKEAGKPGETLAALRPALQAHPRNSKFLEAWGLLLEEAEELGPDRPRDAYQAAVASDPSNARAWASLGRLAEKRGDAEAAMDAYERAVAAGTTAEVMLRYGTLLSDAGREQAADGVFAALIERHPYSGAEALALARRSLEREGATARTLGLARRAARFGGGKDAKELVSLVESRAAEGENESAGA